MSNTVTFLGFTFDLNPVAFTIPIAGGWDVYWYGIAIAIGFLLAFLYGMKKAPTLGLNQDRLLDAIIITTPLAILLARAYYLIFYVSSVSEFFTSFFAIHEGGLAIYGGVIGAVVGAAICSKFRKLNFVDCLDLVAPCLLIGQAIGRWGNFFNQEAFGTNTTLPWGMYSEGSSGTYEHILAMENTSLDPSLPVHPCFLYEFILCAIGFLILSRFINHRKFRGQIALMYGMWYGLSRFFIEGIRTDSLMIGNLRVSQVLSAVAVVASTVIYILLYKKAKAKKDEGEYKEIFGESDAALSLADVLEDEKDKDITDLES